MTPRMRAFVLLPLILGVAVRAEAEGPVARVVVQESGAILLDGEPTSLEGLRVRFAELKEQGGQVWYHRANPEGEPPESAVQVIQLVIDARLPVRLAIDPEFTRFATPGGVGPGK